MSNTQDILHILIGSLLENDQYCCDEGSFEPGWKQTYFWCAEKRITVESHLFQFFIHITDANGKVTLTTPPSYISIATTLLIDCLYSFCRKIPHLREEDTQNI